MNTSLPYLFWIDHVKARLKLVELVFASASCSWTTVYTLENLEELSYRYDDLKPWAVVLDEKQVDSWDQSLVTFFEEREIPVLHLADPQEILHLEKNSCGRLPRELKPMELEKTLQRFYLKIGGSDTVH